MTSGPRAAAFKAATVAGMNDAEAAEFAADYPTDDCDPQRLSAHNILRRILKHAEEHLRSQ